MQYKLLYRTILSILLTTATASIIAQPTLSLNTQAGMAGQQVTATLAITEPGSSSGFNAHIVLPIGVTLIAVNKGDLVSSSAFTLDYHQLNQDLKVIAYSATEAITQAGELLTLILQINNTVVPSLLDLSFSNINSNSLINSKHALSSNDGLSSLAHSVENTKIVVYNTTSDQDGDGMTDQWEISNGLNPFINDAGGDLDGDEYSNLQEFQNGTDPDDNTDFPINNENCGGADVSISDHTYSSLANETCTASTRIATSGNILVSSGASVIYNAPSIILNPGFRVTLGGYFRAEQNPQAAQRVLNNPSETSTQEVNSVVQTIEFSEEDNIEIT
ncbi:MAG: hypothetical protein KAJ63_09435, partial [Methyloprofundus sp.]|nr:hypothetical protein [Methyloprofundus sp.]